MSPRVLLLLALLAGAMAAGGARAQVEPLQISADNVTGSHGPEGDIVFLRGHLRITRGRTVLTADAGRYLRQQGMLFLDGNVRMVDSSTVATCDAASYSETEDLLQLNGHVVIRDGASELRAPAGTYDRRAGRADLTGPVEGLEKDLRITSDRAIYLRDSSLVQARGRVRGVDQEHKTDLEARAVDYDRRTRIAIATGDPVLRARDDDDKVTEIRALRLEVDTQKRVAEAIDSVRVSRDTLQARADRARFDDVAQRGLLLGSPRAWDDQTTVRGDTIEFITEKRALRQTLVRGNAVMDYAGARPNTVGETSRLTGDLVDVRFTNDDIDSLVAIGNAVNEYQAPPRAGKTAERNRATGDTITVFFRDRNIDRARVEGQAKGEYRLATDVGDTTAARREIVTYDARRIQFEVPRNSIVLQGESHLDYGDLSLRADRVVYDVEGQSLVAEGNPRLHDRGDEVTGHLMSYDLATRVGTIYQAETAYEKGLYHGDRIRKVGENELDVMSGAYSTCDLPTPHYHFAAKWMKIYLKDKLVAKPVVFYVRNVPVLALPFWIFPIKPGRHSGFLFPQFELGFNNRAGQFLRNAGYYWAPNDYMDVTATGDYYQADPSYVMRGEGQYNLLYRLRGSFRGTFAKSEDPDFPQEQWSFDADHDQDLGTNTHLTAGAQFVSSRDYNVSDQFGRSLAQRLNRFLTSKVAVTQNAGWANISGFIDRRQDLDAEVTLADPDGEGTRRGPVPGTVASLPSLVQSTPSLAISFPTRAIGSLGLLRGTPLEKPLRSMYFSLSSQFLSLTEKRAFVRGYRTFVRDTVLDSTTVLDRRVTTRRALANVTSLSDSRRLFGWVNLQPRVSANVVVFDFDELGNRVVPTGTWSSGMTMSSTFYGTFRPTWLGLEGLRHIVTPSLSADYSPDFPQLQFVDSLGFRRNRFTGFGGIGVSGFRSARMNFSLDQRFQVKAKRHGKLVRLDNLLSWGMSGQYNFLWREERQAHPLSIISSNVFLQPPGYLNASLSWATDVYRAHPVRSLALNLGMNLASGGAHSTTPAPDLPVDQTAIPEPQFNENWSVGFAYSYSGGYSGPDWQAAQTANVVGRWQFSPAWGIEYSTSYDVPTRSLQTQRFGLSRDLHCWSATFTRTLNVTGEAEYYFRLGIKDQKEIYVERGSRVGSIGGIQ